MIIFDLVNLDFALFGALPFVVYVSPSYTTADAVIDAAIAAVMNAIFILTPVVFKKFWSKYGVS